MLYRLLLPFSLLLIVLVNIIGCSGDQDRKIKLASLESNTQNSNSAASSVLKVSLEEQRSIAILYFENETNDASLDWLRRGLTDMLYTELSQSPYLSVVPMQRMSEISEQQGKTERDLEDLAFATQIANEANAEILLTGRFYNLADSICIEVVMLDAKSSRVLHREVVRGQSLERIFAMVDTLSSRVRANLRTDREEAQTAGVNLADMTTSVDAFRSYSLALENIEKFLWTDAERCMEDAVRYDTTFASAYFNLGKIKLEMGKTQEGEAAIQKARQYYDKLSEADKIYLKLLDTHRDENVNQVIAILEDAVLRFPAEVNFRIDLGRLYRHLGELDKSLEAFEIALEQDPNRKLVYNDLGYLFAERGDFTTALKYIDKYQELAPDEPNPYDSKGEILMIAGRLDEAVTPLETALDKWPNFFHSSLRLSDLYRETCDYKKTMAYIDYTNESLPGSVKDMEVVYRKALAYWRFGQFREAENTFDAIIEKDPYYISPVLAAAEMYKSLGDSAKALRLYQTTFNKFKEDLAAKGENFEYKKGIPLFILVADLPEKEVIAFIEEIATFQKNPDQQAFYDFLSGLICLRAGELEKGIARIHSSRDRQFELLALAKSEGWSELWKYIFETLEYESADTPASQRFSEKLLQYSQQEGLKNLEWMARLARAHFYGLHQQERSLAAEYQYLGIPPESAWRVIGPFSTKGVSGFKHAYPPEEGINLTAAIRSDNRNLKWQSAKDGASDGYVNLKAVLKDANWSVGYALVYIKSPDERKVQIRTGANDAYKLWFNDELVLQRYYTKTTDAVLDRDLVAVALRPGYNKVLIKVENAIHDWGFYLRVTDENGNGFKDISFHSPETLDPSFALQQ